MKIIDLFSGIGGFSLAGHWIGWETVQFCEQNKYCQQLLKQNFPGVPISNDIKTLNHEEIKKGGWNPKEPTILVGGFPCQPFSVAGKQRSKEDDRYLWPQMLRIIRECRPRWVVGENVAGIVNLALDDVCISLENEGYEVRTFIIPACAVGAYHRRDRVWIVANSLNNGHRKAQYGEFKEKDKIQAIKKQKNGSTWEPVRASSYGCAFEVLDTYTNNKRLQRRKETGNIKEGREERKQQPAGHGEFNGKNYWSTEPGMGRMANGVSKRVDRIKALGNAVVPQVVYEIFKVINQVDKELYK
jgi:DNA (cytosine-5)-methyltransferase 1